MIPFGLWWGSGDDRNVPLQEGDLVGDDALERLADVDVESALRDKGAPPRGGMGP